MAAIEDAAAYSFPDILKGKFHAARYFVIEYSFMQSPKQWLPPKREK